MDTNHEQQSYVQRSEEAMKVTNTWDAPSIALAVLALAQEVRELRAEIRRIRELHESNIEVEERLAESRARRAGSLYSLR